MFSLLLGETSFVIKALFKFTKCLITDFLDGSYCMKTVWKNHKFSAQEKREIV